jgi:GGDEF domain-containing protein
MRHIGDHLISLLNHATEIDRTPDQTSEMLSAATECYSLALLSVSQYTPELDPLEVAKFRLHLKNLEDQWRAARTSDNMRAIQASLRGELREYRDQSREQIARLRRELDSAATAIALFAEGIALGGVDDEQQLGKKLEQLESLTKGDDISKVRDGIRVVVGEIAVSLERTRQGSQLTIAQLKDEIRVLHQQFQAERSALFTDPASGAWTRQKADLKINELLRQDDRFCVIAVALRNLPTIRTDHSQAVVDGTLRALLLRCRGMLGDGGLIGRWSDDEFVAILDVEPAAISAISAELAARLRGSYSTQEDGIAHTVVVELAIRSLERACGSDPAEFIRSLEALTEGLRN